MSLGVLVVLWGPYCLHQSIRLLDIGLPIKFFNASLRVKKTVPQLTLGKDFRQLVSVLYNARELLKRECDAKLDMPSVFVDFDV